MYKKHAKFRELDEARNEGNMNELASKSLQQANVQRSQHDESVSFQTVIQETSLKYSLYFVQILIGIVTGTPRVTERDAYVSPPLPYLQTHGFSHQKSAKTTKK